MSIKLATYGSEGRIPHFHFYKEIGHEQGISKEKSKGGGCICLLTANYFIHQNHTETMTRKEIEGLIKFLKLPNKDMPKITNWESIIIGWNQNNPEQTQLPSYLQIPKYTYNMKTIQEDKEGEI